MPIVTILYPNTEGGTFDFDYYLAKHIPWSEELNGSKFDITKGIADVMGGEPTYVCIAKLHVESVDKFVEVMTTHGQALIADMPNYTNIQPIIQFDEKIR
jgi:uncharacterized protein (TIGR02118 family)